jgi:hypothetical protein
MKTIVHIGMPKAGSTALQNCLEGSDEALAAKGVLYPRNPPECRFNNHRLLAARILDFDGLPRHMKGPNGGYTAETIGAGVEAFVDGVAAQVAGRRPDFLVFSSETLFRPLPKARHAAIRDDYRRMGAADPRFVAYLRKPSDRYVAGLMQTLHASTFVKPPRPPLYRAVLESYEACFGPDALDVRLYDRGALRDGDIIADFFSAFLPEAGIDVSTLHAGGKRNETLSGESMDLIMRQRIAFHPDENDVHTRATIRLRDTLTRIEREVGAPKPRLRTRIAEMVDYATPDCLWLRERYGIAFPGIDYDRMEREAAGDGQPFERIRRLDDLIAIDPAIQARIVERLAGEAWATEEAAQAEWVAGLLAPGGLDPVEARPRPPGLRPEKPREKRRESAEAAERRLRREKRARREAAAAAGPAKG